MANKVSEMFEGLTNNFKGMIDANSVVGEPIIVNDGTMIVPISKVSFGFGGGGCEFDRKKNDTQSLGCYGNDALRRYGRHERRTRRRYGRRCVG